MYLGAHFGNKVNDSGLLEIEEVVVGFANGLPGCFAVRWKFLPLGKGLAGGKRFPIGMGGVGLVAELAEGSG